MAEHFAVVDVGSNAMRFQVASVTDRGRHYRIIHQDRKPVRLGHRVFQTGKLDPKVTESALKGLKEFKSIADRYGVAATHSVATAALREANRAGGALEIADEGARDAFFRHALGVFFPGANLNDGGAQAANSGLPRQRRVLVGIDVIHLHFGREIRVLIQQIFALAEFRGLIEVSNPCVLL